jgi:hypothetical protein
MRSGHHDRVNSPGNTTQVLKTYFWSDRVTQIVTDVCGGHLSMSREDPPSGDPNLFIGHLADGYFGQRRAVRTAAAPVDNRHPDYPAKTGSHARTGRSTHAVGDEPKHTLQVVRPKEMTLF